MPHTVLTWKIEDCHAPQGQVTAQGVRTGALNQRQPPRFTLAITGGTGAYNTARGQVRIVDLNATDSRLTLTLIR
jgi:hypothetical protein